VKLYRLFIATLTLLAGCATTPLVPGRSVTLSGPMAYQIARPCSRPGPPKFDDVWEPTQADIAEMEAHFGWLRRLRSTVCCLPGAQVRNVNDYFRQYVGIVVNGRRLIYINAFAADEEPPKSWTHHPINFCDGGTGSWGALYDPATHRFSDLAFNGIG
jgi:hypothetical protein